MKRKVFSLLMLCMFAFLGLANAQSTGTVNANPDPIDLGYRPIGAWMRPFEVQLTTTGAAQSITALEADKDYFVFDAELPGTVSSTSPYKFTVTHGEGEGAINGSLVVMTENRKAYIFDIQAVAYAPIAADVVETAPAITLPFTATVGEGIYNNYLLPGNAADGKDVVYKMTVENDILFSANVEGENGKVALYQEGFGDEPGPGATNNFTGVAVGGATGGPFEAQVGVTTNTSGYIPAYYLYNYSISQQLFLADELIAAGAGKGEITSIAFSSESTYGHLMKNVSIYIGSTNDATVTSTSPNTANMTLVYTGDHQEVVGLNEFEFSTPFEWDGTSNLLVYFIMNNGSWGSTIQWDIHNAGFTASAYNYNDNNTYNPAQSYTMSTTTNRATTLFKGELRNDTPANVAIEGMTLTPGVYFLAASSTSDEFTVNANSDVLPAPEQAYNPYPADGDADVTTPVTLTWTFGEHTTAYRVLLGTTYPPMDVVVDWTNELSNGYYTGNLMNSKNYFWRVDERNSNGVTEGQIWGFTTTLTKPQGLIAANEKIYQGDALELSWNQPTDRSLRGYNVYQDGVKLNTAMLTDTEYTVNGLTYNMEGYTFNVTAVYDEGESGYSNDLVAFVTGNGTVSGKVVELDGTTGIYGVEVSFEGTDEYGRPASSTFTTAANGTFSGNILAGTYTAMALKEGYQGAEFDGNINITFNQNTPNINFTLQETLYPVAEVIAEEVSDEQVKVYWSQNVMSELLEDFETGDFSSFNWVNDPAYPWSVTTTNAYEGTYCMKSGNAGVNSTTSAIEVNVEISRDGLMSFYQKISSESNYDKGYFYLDGTEKVNVSGNGNWQKKEYPITAGVHNFKWAYTKDSSVSSNDDCYYIDNVSFVHDAAPVVPEGPGAWYYYDNGENEDAIGTGGGNFSWGVMFPAGSYTGTAVTKVSAYDYMAMDGTVTIYNDGASAPANAVGTTDVTFEGSAQFVEFPFSSPVAIDPTKNLWVVFYNASGATYPAAVCANTGDANGRWVSIDGVEWSDLAGYDLDYTFMVRAFVSTGAKGEVQEITVNNPHTGGTLAAAGIAKPNNNRAFDHFNIYRAIEGDEANAENIAHVTDTMYLDNDWASLEPGVYKWGVSRVYEGNRNRDNVLFTDDFESGDISNWTTIDADGDGNTWVIATPIAYSIGEPYSGTYCASSWSWNSVTMYPDNYMISPNVAGATSLTYYVATNTAYPDHYGVYASSTGTAAADFTLLFEEVAPGSKGAVAGVERVSTTKPAATRALSPWTERNVTLPAGTKYIAFRHWNSDDMNYLFIDDVTIYGGNGGGGGDDPTGPQLADNESEIVWSEPIEHNMFVSTTVTVTTNSGDDVTGAQIAMNNVNETQYTYNATLDETGVYTWESMRRGSYNVTVSLDGFTTIEESVEIGDHNDLHYVLEESIVAVDGLYVSGTGWAMFGNVPTTDNPDNPTPPSGGWTETFDNGGVPATWTVLDANNDGYTWTATSAIPSTWTYYESLSLDWYHSGTDAVCSGSYINGVGALNPDEYLITPQVTPSAGSTFSFWAAATDASYAADHFGVFVSTTGSAASDFSMVQEWTLTGKRDGMNGGRASRDGKGAKLGTWYNYSVDLSAYAGQTIYIAIRHFNCYDQYIMCVDDVEFTTNRSLEYYNVKLDGHTEGSTSNPFFQHNVEGFEEGSTHTTSVQAVYTTGESEWVDFEWVYTACDNFEGLKEEPTAQWQGEDVVLNWLLPEGGDGPTPPDPQPGTIYDFEDGTMQGWTTIDADGDGYGWEQGSSVLSEGYGHNGSTDLVLSRSYVNYVGALTPDNYLVSPQVTLGGEIKFYACAQDASYAAEHFGVAVSTTSGTSASAFTTIQEWTMTSKGTGAPTNVTRSGNRAQGNWYLYTVDLSAYAGQTGYVAIRHFNCTDMFYLNVDDIELGGNGGGGDDPTPPDPPVGGETYTFDDGTMQGWTTIDADGDGYGWEQGSSVLSEGYGHNGSADLVLSRSYVNYVGALTPDNYLVSPAVNLGGSISFYACAQDASYAAEHFGVAVSTTSGTSASAFTTIQEWTMTAKGTGAPTDHTRSGNRAQGNWYLYTVDLSAYAGQTGYVAIRHFNCTDMFYLNVDDITVGDSKKTRETTYNFDDGTMQGWTTLDADGDGYAWEQGSSVLSEGYGHNGSADLVLSRSYVNYVGALTPDNYLVSPQVTLGGSMSFYACAQDASYAAEHFGVAVSTTSGTSASAFTTIQEWTMTAKGTGAPTNHTRSGNRAQGNWYLYTVDLSAYEGQTGYVAIRHFNCTDMFYLNVDDITLGGTAVDPVDPDDPDDPNPPTPGASVRGVEIFRDGVWIAEVASPAQTFTDVAPGEVGEYEIRVVYNGNTEDYTHYTMSCPQVCVPVEFNCLAPENLTGSYEFFNDGNFGAFINWTYSGEVSSEMLSYDNGATFDGNAAGLGGGAFKWASMWPAGSFTGNMISKISNPDPIAMTGTLSIYSGGTSEPGTLITSKNITFTGVEDFVDFEFDEPVMIDPTQNLWVVFDNVSGATYPAAITADVTNDPNGRWLYVEGYGWLDMAAAGLSGYSWMIHAYVSDAVLFNVYRNNEVVATVPYSGESMTYYDEAAIGSYQYQVTAVTSECESDFALTPDLSQNYVEIAITSVAEVNDTRIYPNPTTGNVTIEAAGMNHITVVNTLGQVLYDTNVNGDQMSLNLGQFKAGVYMLRITTESGVSVSRVTVTK